MRLPEGTTARARRHAAMQLWCVNIVLGTVLARGYLTHVPLDDTPRLWLFALPALLSSVMILTLLPGGLLTLAAHFLNAPRVLGVLQAILWTVFQVLLYADTRIYNIFRYHFNGQILNLVYARGSEDSIHLGWQVWTAVGLGLGCVGLFELWMWGRALRHASQRAPASGRRWFLPRPALIWGAVLLPALFIEKTIYAQADLSRDHQIKALAKVFPLYARVPLDDLASKVLGSDVYRPPRVELEGVSVHYPLAVPTVDADGARPNLLVLVVDCWRQDLLDAEHSPHIARWAEDCRRFEDHVSGGNSTRYGIFSMIYGLHGSYWFPFLQEMRSPVLVDALLELGYEMGVFSSASMNYPELRSTVWQRIPECVHDDFPSEHPWRRDEMAAAEMIRWLAEREQDDAPFFGFLLLDAPHQTYSHPPERTPFTPSAEELDYLALTDDDGPDPGELERIYHRYLNAVHHADRVAGAILEFLRSSTLLEDTVVIVTSDHGEEFWECGFFGHTSAYTRPQIAVPFLMRGPGIEPGVESRPTSHLDVAPTLLEMLGADPSVREAWTLGANLLDPPVERRRVISGWNEIGVWAPDGILRVPLSLLEFDIEVYDYEWRLLSNDLEILRAEAETLIQLGKECNRFLR